MQKEEFYRFLDHPELLDDRSVSFFEKILSEYPYFQTARLLHLKNLNNQGSFQYDKELKKTAVWITDRSQLFFLLDKRVLLPVYEKGATMDETISSVSGNENEPLDFDAFTQITDFPDSVHETPQQEIVENDELERLIIAGSAQSSTFFEVDDTFNLNDFKNTFKKKKSETNANEPAMEPENRRKKLIDTFILEQPKIVPRETPVGEDERKPVVHSDESADMMTDTLAKIYVKQGFYEKAISAYEKLSLKFPEKNSYFASQIGKIKQIINNQ